MQLKLLLKQSFRDFFSKIILYLTFSLFLILAISISLGMISFSYGFTSTFNKTLGNQRVNAAYTSMESFLPAWVDENEPGISNFSMKEKVENSSGGYLFNFLKTVLNDDNSTQVADEDLQKLLLGIGYYQGYAYELNNQILLENQVLSNYIKTDEDLATYNTNVNLLKSKLNLEFQTVNLSTAFFLNKIANNSNFTLSSQRLWNEDFKLIGHEDSKVYWNFLKTDNSMKVLNDETPQALKINPTNFQKTWKQIDLNKPQYRDFINSQRLVYVQPYFLQTFKYKIGQTISIRFTDWDYSEHPAEPLTLLIAGTISSPDNISIGYGPTISLPFKLITDQFDYYNSQNGQTTQQLIGNRPVAFYNTLYFNVFSKNKDLNGGQKVASTFFNEIFDNLQNPSVPLQNSTDWARSYPSYSYQLSQTIFLIIAYTIGFFILGLLFIIFYFITQQIVALQRKSLFFLKAMGVRNYSLSLLTTFAILPSMFVALVFGFFGALMIQQTMYSTALNTTSFTFVYFDFNFVFFVFLIGVIIFSFLIFYLINTLLIKSKALTLEGMNSLKSNTKIFKKIKSKLNKTPAQLRIGLSFTFKNIYKNLISFLVLSITFGIILFANQFNKSLIISAHAYEKWNKPYQSVNYAEALKVFSPVKTEDEYVRTFETVNTLSGMKVIKSFDLSQANDPTDLYNVILEYQKKINNDSSSTFTNWKDYYLDKDFVKEKLDLITDDQEEYDKFIQQLTAAVNDEDIASKIANLVSQIVEKYREIRKNYDYYDGFYILLGRVFAPQNNRSVLSLSGNYLAKNFDIRTLAFANNDFSTQKHFGFTNNLSNDDFLINGTYQEFDSKTNKIINKKGKLLRVNVSSYLQTKENLHHGDVIALEMSGLKSADNVQSSKVYVYVDRIVRGDSIQSTIFTSQVGLINYVIEDLTQKLVDHQDDQDLIQQQQVYKDLLAQMFKESQPQTLNNTVFDQTNIIPIGLRFLTIPIFNHTNVDEELGSRIEDFYDESESSKYFNQLGSSTMIFSEVTQKLLKTANPFNEILQKFIWILIIVSFVVSLILITLVLLENREVILLFKAMGYKKSEINWYLISGYFVSAILATLVAVILSWVVLNATRGAIAQYFASSVYFIWSWQFIVFALGLAVVFCLLISTSIIVYTNIQKPKDAFAIL